MKKRLFTFGCSSTRYHWPMWADIVAQDHEYYENWGQIGAGNKFIYFSLVECHQRNNITADDTVMIMWSSQAREDRYIKGKWHTPGSVYNSDYSDEFIEEYTDTTGYLLDTVTYMQSGENLLNSIGCTKHYFSALPLYLSSDLIPFWMSYLVKKINPGISEKILELYQPVLKQIKPSSYENIWKCDWSSRDKTIIQQDMQESYDNLYKNYKKNAGESWPSFDDFFNDNIQKVKSNVIKEIDKQFDFINTRDKVKLLKRTDPHLTPGENLEYLHSINFSLSTKAIEFAEYWDKLVMSGQGSKWPNKGKPVRF